MPHHKYLGTCLCLIGSLSLLPSCAPVAIGGAGAGVVDVATQDRGIKGTLNDTNIRTQINSLFLKQSGHLFANVGLAVQNGQVLLTGSVLTAENRAEAARLVWQVKGVVSVFNEIKVGEPHSFGDASYDVWISTKVRSALIATENIHSNNYSVTTFNGVVYLMGIAQNQQELNRAINVAKNIKGVKKVISYMIIK